MPALLFHRIENVVVVPRATAVAVYSILLFEF